MRITGYRDGTGLERSVVNSRFRCYARGNPAESGPVVQRSFSCLRSAPMLDEGPTSNRANPAPNRLEREESQLWRWALGLLVLFATAVAALSWEQLKDLPYRLWAIPAGLFLLAILFATYAFGRKREASELKQILKGFQNQAGVTPSEEQLDQLGQLIMRSQRNFKEIIDSLDDAAFAVSLDGTLKTVNRRTSETLGFPYSALFAHKLEQF